MVHLMIKLMENHRLFLMPKLVQMIMYIWPMLLTPKFVRFRFNWFKNRPMSSKSHLRLLQIRSIWLKFKKKEAGKRPKIA